MKWRGEVEERLRAMRVNILRLMCWRVFPRSTGGAGRPALATVLPLLLDILRASESSRWWKATVMQGMASGLRQRLLRRRCGRSVGRRRLTVLGIETSCDDTSAAVVEAGAGPEEPGRLLGQAHVSQLALHNRFGGTNLKLAQDEHSRLIGPVVAEALRSAGLERTDWLAVSTRPGIVQSLGVGAAKAVELSRAWRAGLVKVHHMRAHALVARLVEPELRFPFLALLVSGGHALLASVLGPEDVRLFGSSRDTAPGDLLDKVARRLHLRFLRPQLGDVSGGEAVSILADDGDPHFLRFRPAISSLDCDFSFSPLRTRAEQQIARLERAEGLSGTAVLGRAADVAASVQHTVFRQVADRALRAMELSSELERLGEGGGGWSRTLVLGGGCAANAYLRRGLGYAAQRLGWRLLTLPPALCGDNGAMVAWAGLDTLRRSLGPQGQAPDDHPDVLLPHRVPDEIWVEHRALIGQDWTQRIKDFNWTIRSEIQLDDPSLFLPH